MDPVQKTSWATGAETTSQEAREERGRSAAVEMNALELHLESSPQESGGAVGLLEGGMRVKEPLAPEARELLVQLIQRSPGVGRAQHGVWLAVRAAPAGCWVATGWGAWLFPAPRVQGS